MTETIAPAITNTTAALNAAAKLITDVKTALTGGSTLEEAVLIGQAALTDLVPAIAAISGVESEFKANPIAAAADAIQGVKAIFLAIFG